MHDQRSEGNRWLPGDNEVARIVLSILIKRYPALVERDDLTRELCEPSLTQRVDEPLLEDAITDLTTSRLAHRLDRFLVASRTALRASELLDL